MVIFMVKPKASESGTGCSESKSGVFTKGIVILIVGLLFLVENYGVDISWWRVEPWTAVFILFGLSYLCRGWNR